MKDLPRRTATALVYGAVVLVAIASPPFLLWILLLAAAAVGAIELAALRGERPVLCLSLVFFAGLVSLGALREMGNGGARHGTPDWVPVLLLLVVFPTWSADVAAYFVGSSVGRRHLAPRISPGKTWEGTIAGFIACTAVAITVGIAFGLPRLPTTIVAIGLGPAGLAGDLLESFVKRRAGLKDSGTILPGHGGILDRLDSLTAGALYALVVISAYGLSQVGAEGGLVDRF